MTDPISKQTDDIQPAPGVLIVARHHESEWNKLGEWTGSRDVHLTPYGLAKSGEMGLLIKGIHIDQAFASAQVRSLETLQAMLSAMGETAVPIIRSAAINERDYGEYTGKNKWEMKKILGDVQYEHVHRDWDCPIPGGETLKTVYARVEPFYIEHIFPLVQAGKTILMVSHGNAIRALMKYIENISDEDVSHLEMLFGAVVIYKIDQTGHMLEKEVRRVESKVNA